MTAGLKLRARFEGNDGARRSFQQLFGTVWTEFGGPYSRQGGANPVPQKCNDTEAGRRKEATQVSTELTTKVLTS